MIQLIFAAILIFLIIIYPVMLAARMVGAGRTGAGSAVFAILLQVAYGVGIRLFIADPLLLGVAAVVGGSVIYALALQTTILRGFAVSIIAVAIVVGAVLLLSAVGAILGV